MLVYTGTKKQFNQDVESNMIADKIQREFEKHDFHHNNDNEFRAWENSLRCMDLVLHDGEIDDDCHVAIEYVIPLTSKRVDFIITGKIIMDKTMALLSN